MQILKIISRLMDYPNTEVQCGAEEIKSLIQQTVEISPRQRAALLALVADVYGDDLMEAQERYTSLFDRGRALSLLLFEHVHGESRDRGQAMVDLMAQYETAGFSIAVKELPDYIPLYLEYLSTREDIEARVGLADVAHILGLLAARLQERDSPYAALFTALLQISGAEVDMTELNKQVESEERDDSPEALDKIWEEEAITFGMGDNDTSQGACPSSSLSSSAMHNADRGQSAKQTIAEAVHFVNRSAS